MASTVPWGVISTLPNQNKSKESKEKGVSSAYSTKKLIKVGKYFPSSQICSNCGKLNSEIRDINIRDWECPVCGAKLNRDINAAINIKNEGLRLLSLQ